MRGFTKNKAAKLHLDDFAQEAIIQVHARIDSYLFQSRFLTWAQSIAVNIALTEIRRARWKDCSLDDLEKGARETFRTPDTGASGSDPYIKKMLTRAINESLSAKQQTAIYSLLADVPLDQIAATLNLNRNALYKLLHDSRRRLKRHLTVLGLTKEIAMEAFKP